MDERPTNGGAHDGGRLDDGVNVEQTDRVDFTRLFSVNLGLAISACGGSIAELGGKLTTYSTARRRAVLFGLLEELDTVLDKIGDAKTIIREQAHQTWIESAKDTAK